MNSSFCEINFNSGQHEANHFLKRGKDKFRSKRYDSYIGSEVSVARFLLILTALNEDVLQ
jgi:hypothetical protein